MSYLVRACSAWQRRSSLHERRDSLSLRDMRAESQKLQESLLLTVRAEEEDEDDKMPESPITVVISRDSTVLLIILSRTRHCDIYCCCLFYHTPCTVVLPGIS